MGIRVGYGYDVHRLVSGRPCILGGIQIPSEFGPDGHSDADVLLHAITDAILGALALGDIGEHFPDTDPQWKGADSKKLLVSCLEKVHLQGWVVGNVDCTVVLERPKLRAHIERMRASVAELLQIDKDAVGIKATTSEKMGFVGTGHGIAAHAVALVHKLGA